MIACLGRDEDLLPRNSALPDRVSNLSLVLRVDVSLCDSFAGGNVGVRTP